MSPDEPDGRSIPDLVRDLLRAVLGLVRSTARMAGLEARDILRRAGRRIALLIVASLFVGAGLILVLGGLSLVAETAFGLPRWASFVLVGLVALGGGTLGLLSAIRRLGDPDLAFPETVAELAKDVDALASERRAP